MLYFVLFEEHGIGRSQFVFFFLVSRLINALYLDPKISIWRDRVFWLA